MPSTSRKRPTGRTSSRSRRAKRRPMTPQDLHRFHWVSDPQMAPDGSRIVFVKKHVGDKNEYWRDLWMVDSAGGAPRRFTASGKDAHPRWSPDGARVAFLAGRDKGRPQIWLISAEGGEAVALTSFPEGSIGDFRWSPDGTQIAVAYRELAAERTSKAAKEREDKGLSTPPMVIDDWWYRLDGDGYFGADRFALFLVDVATGAARKVFDRDPTGMFSFDFAPDGKQLAICANLDRKALVRPWKSRLFLYDLRHGKLAELPNQIDGAKSGVQWSPDGRYLAYAGREGGPGGDYDTRNLELWLYDLERKSARSLTGKEDYCLLAAAISDAADVDFAPSFQWAPNGKSLLTRIGWHGETHIASIAARGGKLQFLTSGTLAFEPGSLDRTGRKLGLVVSGPTELGEVYLGAVGAGAIAATKLTSFNAELHAEIELSRPKSNWVPSTNGTRVQVWSMLPPGTKSNRRGLPAVLEIHGGPHAQYGVSLFHEFQVLAAAGYAVFFSNPRGSKGYGQEFCDAIRGNWGSADWDDIQAATSFIQAHPNVDAKRIGIMGGSYGGYMTNWAIGHSNVYAAAITDRCVSNLVSMCGSSDVLEEPGAYFPGNTWDRAEELWLQSPLKYFGKVRTPTLVIHSEGDLRCNVEQGEQVFAALKLRNIPTRFVRYPNSTSHGMSRNGPPDLRLHRLDQILGWLGKYLARRR